MLLGLQLIANEVLNGLGLGGSGIVAVTEFLKLAKVGQQFNYFRGLGGELVTYANVEEHVLLDRREGDRTEVV